MIIKKALGIYQFEPLLNTNLIQFSTSNHTDFIENLLYSHLHIIIIMETALYNQ